MLNFYFFCILFFFVNTKTFGAELCFDFLGLDKYCKVATSFIDKHKIGCVGYLFNTFADEPRCLEQITKNTSVKTIRVHLFNGAGLRNKKLGNYEGFRGDIPTFNDAIQKRNPGLLKIFIDRAKRIEKITKDNNLTCYLSPVLEDNLEAPQRLFLANLLRTYAPSCKVVINPVNHNVARVENSIHELHGYDIKIPNGNNNCAVSLDGITEPVDLKAYLTKYATCNLVFLWDQSFNCRKEGTFIDPRKRPEKDCTTASILEKYMSQVLVPKTRELPKTNPEDLKRCNKIIKAEDGYKKGFVWKISDHPRPGKQTVSVFPITNSARFEKVRIVDNRKVIDTLTFCGWANPEGGKNRQHWCSNKKNNQIPSGAILQSILNKKIDCRVLDNPRSGRID